MKNFKKYKQEKKEELLGSIKEKLESITKEEDEEDNKHLNGSFEVVATTESKDRHGEVVKTEGLDFSNYKKNPVVFFRHKMTDLPIGVVEGVEKKENKTIMKGKFASKEANPKAQRIRKLYDAGVMRAVSIGFIPLEKEDEVVQEAEVIELSFVGMPANPDAVSTAQEKGIEVNDILEDELMTKEGIQEMLTTKAEEQDEEEGEDSDENEGEQDEKENNEQEGGNTQDEEQDGSKNESEADEDEDEDEKKLDKKSIEDIAVQMQRLRKDIDKKINETSQKIQSIVMDNFEPKDNTRTRSCENCSNVIKGEPMEVKLNEDGEQVCTECERTLEEIKEQMAGNKKEEVSNEEYKAKENQIDELIDLAVNQINNFN